MTVKISPPYYDLLPVGEYPAVIDSVEIVDTRYGEKVLLMFRLQGQYEGRVVPGWVNVTFHPKSKLHSYTRTALGGAPIPREKSFEGDEIIGKQVIACVKQIDGEDGVYNAVVDVMSYKPQDPDSPSEEDIATQD